MNKKCLSLLVVSAIAFPAIVGAQTITGNMDANAVRGQLLSFTANVSLGSFKGDLSVYIHSSEGLLLKDTTILPPVLTCSSLSSYFTKCSGKDVSGLFSVTQKIDVSKDATHALQSWSIELGGDFLSGAPVRVGQITLDGRPYIVAYPKYYNLAGTGAPPLIIMQGDIARDGLIGLFNRGDGVGTATISIESGPALTITPSDVTLGPREYQAVTVTGSPNQPIGTYEGTVKITRPPLDPISFRFIIYVGKPPSAPAAPTPASSTIYVTSSAAGISGVRLPSDESIASNAIATATLTITNQGNGDVVGAFTADQSWIIPPDGLITIRPAETKDFSVGVDFSNRPNETGSLTGTITLLYLNAASGKGLRPLDTGGTSSVSITLVATVPPASSTSAIPPLAKRCQPMGCWDESAIFVPGVGHVVGSVGLFISDVTLYPKVGHGDNPAFRSLSDVDMYFTPLAVQSSSAKKITVSAVLPPSSAAFGDMVSTVYASTQQVGTLQIRAPGFLPEEVVALNANVFNVSNKAGTYGTSLPMFLSYAAVNASDKEFLTGLRKGATSHTNMYLQEALGSDITANIDFYDPAGTKLGSTSAFIPAFGAVQLGGSTVPNGTVSAAVSVLTGNGALHAYATPVDEASGDTWVVADWSRVYFYYMSYLPPIGVNVLIPVAGAAHGANNTYFKTDAAIMNVGSTPASGTLRYFIRGGGTVEKSINLNPLQTQVFDDINTNFFGVTTDSVGYMTYTPTTGRVAITSRNYTTTPGSAATFGTAVPTLPIRTTFGTGGVFAGSGISKGGTVRIAGIEDAALTTVGAAQGGSFRSNFGLVETAGQPATVKVTIYYNTNSDKTAVTQGGSKSYDLAPNQFLLVGNIANAVLGTDRANLGDLHNMTVEFTVTGGTGRVVPFISSIDNGTGDSTFRVN